MKTYRGIIDNLGMESFVLKETNTFPYKLRAALNPQRNAKAYEVDLNNDEIDIITEMILEKDWKELARKLKSFKTFRWV